ncbi:MAG: nucleotide exchange factor GrpE [Clostridia bacterium]|nr:nucleotide exchange factor GrpE [Clostridia bacterium]
MKKNKAKTQRDAADRTIRDRIRGAADSLKERAKNMNSEEKISKAAEGEQETCETRQPDEAKEQQEDIEALRAELEKTKAQCEEYLDMAQRKQAEFANYRRRTESVRQEAFDDGRREAVGKLLPVVDNLERALAAAGEEDSALKEGVEMVLRQMQDALAKMGVTEIDPQGQPFDAELMNAVMQGSSDEGEPGTVCMVLQKGYSLGGRVIRHAMVKVVAG